MMKVDVGWGQGGFPAICPNNLLQNPNFVLNPGVTDGWNAFCAGEVANWGGVDNTPHVIMQTQPSPQFGCDTDITDPTNTIACLRSGPADPLDPAFTESIFQTGLSFSQDPLVNYSVDLAVNLMNCGMLNSFTNMDVYLLNAGNIPQACINNTTGWVPPVLTSNKIVSRIVDWYNLQSVVQNIGLPNNTFDAIYIRSWKQVNSGEIDQTVLGIDNVTLTCRTTALDDLVINNTAGRTYEFGAVNISTVSTFTNYLWRITNLITNEVVFESNQTNPNFTFANSGQYNVCLDIVDNNGCCATRCEQLTVPCDDPVAVFTYTGTCPNYTFFVPTQQSEGNTFSWLVNDQPISTNGTFQYTFPANGTYTIVLQVTNECGETKSYSLTLTIDCICDPPVGDFNFNVACINGQGQVTFNVTNGQPGDTYIWNFGDGTANATTTSPTIIHTYTGHQTYTVTLTITNSCNKSKTVQKNVVVMCSNMCHQNDGRTQYTINGGNGGIDFSVALTSLGVPYNPSSINPFINLNFVLIGEVTMDLSAYFDNCKFIAMPGAELVVSPVATSTFNKGSSTFLGCNFFGCTHMWKGIRVEGAEATFTSGKIRDALYGIHAANSGTLVVTSVEFSHSFVGVYLTSNPSHTFAGNSFTGGSLLPEYNGYPAYASRNYAGIYAQGGITFLPNGNIDFGCVSLTVGEKNGAPNIFNNLQNGIIHTGGFGTRVKNNTFSNLIGQPAAGQFTNVSLSSNGIRGIGLLISGGALFGNEIEKNVMSNGHMGVVVVGNSLGQTTIKDHNQFTNFQHGVYVSDGGGIFGGQFNITQKNTFTCKANGILFTENYGPRFDCNDNTFYQSNTVATVVGSNGIRVNSLSGGSLGNWGLGSIGANKFYISTLLPTEGSIIVEKYGNLSVAGNDIYILSKPSAPFDSHNGIYLNDVSFADVYGNNVYNNSLETFTGRNTFANVARSAVCCNYTQGLKQGFNFTLANTGRSFFGGNTMHNNERGIDLNANCKIGDQIDKGNIWTGFIRVASLGAGTSDFNNRFFANENQNYIMPTAPFTPVDFWPTQLPSDWFRDSPNNAPEGCHETSCDADTQSLTSGDAPETETLQQLEERLDHQHVGTGAYADASIWYKERWLYGYLNSQPEMMAPSEALTSFYQNADEDVRSYEMFYKSIADRLTLPPSTRMILDTYREQASALSISHDEIWEAYKIGPSATLYDQLVAIQNQLGQIQASSNALVVEHETGMSTFWENMRNEANALPESKPYTQVAKRYAQIFIDRMIYGDDYVKEYHMGTLQYIASLCEPLYPESVLLARNMLVHLGTNTVYTNQDNCVETEIRNRDQDFANTEVKIIPNPTTGGVDVLSESEIKTIELWNTNGLLLQSYGKTNHLDLSGYSNGIYFLTILDIHGGKVTKKLIKIE